MYFFAKNCRVAIRYQKKIERENAKSVAIKIKCKDMMIAYIIFDVSGIGVTNFFYFI